MAREKLRVRVRWFTADTLEVGPVSIGVLRPGRVVESVEVGDPIEVMLRIAEENVKARKGDYFEVSVEGAELREVIGESPRYRWSRPLFPLPTRLRRVGVVRLGHLNRPGEGGFFSFKLGGVEWYDVEGEVYVYEGKLDAPGDVLYVILDTDRGRRVVRVQYVSMQKLSSQPPPPQGQGSDHSEVGSDGGSSPS